MGDSVRSLPSMRYDKLTLKSQEAVQRSHEMAAERNHNFVESVHLLAALIDPFDFYPDHESSPRFPSVARLVAWIRRARG